MCENSLRLLLHELQGLQNSPIVTVRGRTDANILRTIMSLFLRMTNDSAAIYGLCVNYLYRLHLHAIILEDFHFVA